MDELRESSLLFSLEGLLETERERVQREAREAQKRRDEEMIRVAEQASRRRLALLQEREARERREVLEQERERLEEQRIDAMKRATVERARIETEGKMRLIELEQVRKHDLALSQIRERQQAARYRGLTWLSSAGLALVVIGAFGAYFGWLQPAEARQQQHLESEIRVNAEQTKTAQRALASEHLRNQTLSDRIEQLEARQAELLATPAAAKPITPPPGHVGGTSVKEPVHRATTNCPDDGDPLRGCLVTSGHRR